MPFLSSDIRASLCLMTARVTASLPSLRARPVRGASRSSTLATSFTCRVRSPTLNQTFPMSSQELAKERNLTL